MTTRNTSETNPSQSGLPEVKKEVHEDPSGKPELKKEANVATIELAPPIRTYRDMQKLLDDLEATSRKENSTSDDQEGFQVDFVASWDSAMDAGDSGVETIVDLEDHEEEIIMADADVTEETEIVEAEPVREALVTVESDDATETLNPACAGVPEDSAEELREANAEEVC